MADDLDSLLAERAGADEADIDSLLAGRAAAPDSQDTFKVPTEAERAELDAWNKQSQDLPWYQRAIKGAYDPLLGVGQLAQNVMPDAVMNLGRKLTDPVVNAFMGGEPQDTSNTSTADFNQMVGRTEQGYQSKRAAAGQEGLDWWRVGGTVANPMTWIGPSGQVSSAYQAIKAGAQSGLYQALLQPVTTPGNFALNKTLQEGAGAVIGGTLGGAFYGLSKGVGEATRWLRQRIDIGDDAAVDAAASKLTDEALDATGATAAKVDRDAYSAIRQEVKDSLKAGVEPDPAVMARRADAAALPIPIRDVTRGQLTNDPMQWAMEQRLKGMEGAGEPLTDVLASQNRALVENLNVIGARTAPSSFDASQKIIDRIETVDKTMSDAVDQAYKAVRNAEGRPAAMSNTRFTELAKNGLTEGRPELANLVSLADNLPDSVRKTYNALATGEIPLTVDTAQFLDRTWGAVQRGNLDDASKLAIGKLRSALNETPIDDQLGADAMQAYKAARTMAKQRFDLIDANPAYKAVVNGTSKAEPDKFFQNFVLGGNVADVGKLKQLVGPEGTSTMQQAMLRHLKKAAVGAASDEKAVFSQSGYNRVLQDEVMGPRIQNLFKESPELLGQIYRIGRVSETLLKEPAVSSVNRSNTAAQSANIVRDVLKSEVGGKLVDLIPGGRTVRHMTEKAGAEMAAKKAVNAALTPGVTSTPLQNVAPSANVMKLSDLMSKAAASGVIGEMQDER